MALKLRIASLDSVPENVRSLYRPVSDQEKSYSDGKITFQEGFILDVDGAVDKARLDDMREGNIALKTERDALTTKVSEFDGKLKGFGDATPDQIADWKRKAEAGGSNVKVEEAVKQATEAMKAEHAKQIEEANRKMAERDDQLKAKDGAIHGMKIDGQFRDLAAKMAVQSTAIEDVLRRARETFKVDEKGNLVPYKQDGTVLYSGKDAEAMKPEEWMSKLTESSPHLFDKSKGGGASGGGTADGVTYVSEKDAGRYIKEIADGTVQISPEGGAG